MQNHGPKRVYTPQSLEFWFSRLEHNWETYFTPAQLEGGHAIYRDGDVRELELTAGDAIIHRRIEKKDEYAVIEWGERGFSVRSSSTDTDAAHALAVAGLHEIEELVADEISPLPDTTPPIPAPPATSTERRPAPITKLATPNAEKTPVTAAARPAASPPAAAPSLPAASAGAARTLLLSFRTTDEGLGFATLWLGADKSRVAALGPASREPGVPHASSSERAKLIGLASYARKSHFVYRQDTGLYLMTSVAEIPNFLRSTLPAWRKVFGIELDQASTLLLKGPQEVTIEALAGSGRRARGSNDASLDLRWIFKAGEKLLSDAEVKTLLARNTTPVVLADVGIVSLPVEKLAAVRAWQKNAADTIGEAAPLSPYLVFSLFNDARFKLTLTPELSAWRDSVLAPAPIVENLPTRLRPYQRRGVEWMRHLCETGCHGLLADEMGLGKTLQVITLLATRPVPGLSSIIVCPASVVPVWKEEIARFHPELSVEILKTGHDFASYKPAPSVWLASYTQLRKHRALLEKHRFAYAVLDEGQFIKNPDAKITQTCFAVRAAHRLVLTGTPLENRQLDLWSIFRFLLPGLLGSRAGFEAAIATDRAATLTRLRAQLAPFKLRRTKAEVASELPPKQEMDLICPLTDVQRAEYARICNEGLARLGDDVGLAMREKSFGFLALLTRLRQVCCDPDMLPWRKAPLADSGKISLLIEKLSEVVGNGHKVVIFSQFVMLLDRVKEALAQSFPDLPRHELTGMTLDRQKPVQSFQSAEGAAVMLVSLKAAGTGITLHAADYVFLLDPWWNPAVEAQAVDRVHRLGQKSTVFVYRMVTAGTIEERIQALKDSKKELFEQVVGSGQEGPLDLSRHFLSLRDLVQLTDLPEPANNAGENDSADT